MTSDQLCLYPINCNWKPMNGDDFAKEIPEVHCGILLRITDTPFCAKTITYIGGVCAQWLRHRRTSCGTEESLKKTTNPRLCCWKLQLERCPSAAEGRFIFGATSALIRCWSGSNLASRVRSIIFCSPKVQPMVNQTRKICTWNKRPSQSCAFNPPLPSLSWNWPGTSGSLHHPSLHPSLHSGRRCTWLSLESVPLSKLMFGKITKWPSAAWSRPFLPSSLSTWRTYQASSSVHPNFRTVSASHRSVIAQVSNPRPVNDSMWLYLWRSSCYNWRVSQMVLKTSLKKAWGTPVKKVLCGETQPETFKLSLGIWVVEVIVVIVLCRWSHRRRHLYVNMNIKKSRKKHIS